MSVNIPSKAHRLNARAAKLRAELKDITANGGDINGAKFDRMTKLADELDEAQEQLKEIVVERARNL